MKNFIKDPLSHFLLAGILLFSVLAFLDEEDVDDRTIVVDRAALLTFIQYRTKVFKPDLAAKQLDGMSEESKQQLIEDYVKEEAMYRESKALGLDGDDYVIRRRMVQKLEFITQGFIEQSLDIKEQALEKFFQDNIDDYYIDASVTFTHVFFSNESRGADNQDAARDRAQSLLGRLNEQQVPFSESMSYGERFPFHVNYVERTTEFVASHFGQPFADAVFDINEMDFSQWLGPIQSDYGWHLIKIKNRVEGRNPELEEVEGMVVQDYRLHVMREKQNESIDKVIELYDVVIP